MNFDPNDHDLFPPQIQKRTLELIKNRIGFGYVTPSLILRTSSPLIEKLSNADGEEIIGQPVTELFDELYGSDEDLRAILKGDLPYFQIREVNHVQEDQTIEYYDFTVYPADEVASGLGLLIVIEERTEEGQMMQNIIQQRNELRLLQYRLAEANAELHRLDHLKTLFLSMAAHDLRTPLAIISGYADMLIDAPKELNILEFAHLILEQSLWLNTLIDGILDLQLIESNQLPINPFVQDLGQTINALVGDYRPILSSRHIEITYEPPTSPILLSFDANRIKQVAYNLIGNSAKFIGESGQIKVKLEKVEAQNMARLSFEDNGPGIQTEQQERLFELFYRTKGGRKVKGSGIGLFIVKSIVDGHNGEIRVESSLGEGATFIIDLPLTEHIAQ